MSENKIKKILGLVLFAFVVGLAFLFFHQIVNYIYTGDNNLAAILRATKVTTVKTLTEQAVEVSIIDPGLPRGPSCQNDSPLLWENIAEEIDDRIQGITAGPTTINIWTTRGNASGGWVRNPNVWTARGETPVDLTGISPWNSWGFTQRAGVLITPRHFAMAQHFEIVPGQTIIFVDNANNVVSRIVVDSRRVGSTDIKIGTLDADVPPTIAHYSILDSLDLLNFTEGAETYMKRSDHILPIFYSEQEDKALIDETFEVWPLATFGHDTPESPTREAFSEALGVGDSGDVNAVIINGGLSILTSHYTTQTGPGYIFNRAGIETAIDSMNTGYDVTVQNLDCFEHNVAPNFSRSTYDFRVPANYIAGTIIGRVFATDENTSDDVLTYTLRNTQGGEPQNFAIDSSGNIAVLQSGLLNAANPSVTFLAVATDDWNTQMSDTAQITLSLSNVRPSSVPVNQASNEVALNEPNAVAPVFDQPTYTFSIQEDLANGTLVGQTHATDDVDQTLAYSISNGNEHGIFSVNETTGAINISNSSSGQYRAPNVFTLIVRAEDSAQNSGAAQVEVTITSSGSTPADDEENGDGSGGSSGGGGGGSSGGGGGGSAPSDQSIPDLPPPPGSGASIQEQISYLQEVVRILILRLRAQTNQNGQVFQSNNTASISSCENMTIGHTSPCVQTLQRHLNSHGFVVSATGPGSNGQETMYFGPATAQAVVRFQVAFGITPAIGFFGPITRTRMAGQP